MEMIKAVFFDLDDTLRDRYGVLEECLRPVLEVALRCHPGLSAVALRESFGELEGRVLTPSGKVYTLQALFSDVLAHSQVDDPELAGEMAQVYEERRAATLRCFPGVRPLLKELKGRYLLGIITNGLDSVQRGKLAKLGLEDYFRFVITAQAAGCEKPAAEIFLRALEEAGCQPAEALYVGDLLEVDVAGAKGVGMAAAWLNRRGEAILPGAVQPDYELRTLDELLAIL